MDFCIGLFTLSCVRLFVFRLSFSVEVLTFLSVLISELLNPWCNMCECILTDRWCCPVHPSARRREKAASPSFRCSMLPGPTSCVVLSLTTWAPLLLHLHQHPHRQRPPQPYQTPPLTPATCPDKSKESHVSEYTPLFWMFLIQILMWQHSDITFPSLCSDWSTAVCGGRDNFLCATGICVPEKLVCNGYNDCDDWSDEAHCGEANKETQNF